ncbi:hypothetical protein SAMN04487895_101717 [Paenibacillus sophorae]|uniref:Uncharacterized protein n=1 Tax=Paenibacillus sophorae TaxID=1333845 RepID=A0A1H8H1G5_9BACL|nr:hypothetical protein [Paenibacillus sophorae]QWU14407.1 hypothetical protein KP014_21095 [Paenibacillus sophorae]SEN49859.1 hypothetical protein SAMN04487895_101717 [Paenibacillus sophorae]
MDEWGRYFEYIKIGHKISIEKVYRNPRGKLTRYGLINDLEELIVNILIKDTTGELLLPKSKLFKLLNMVNDNYNFCRYHIPKLSILTDVSENEIHKFYGLSKDSLTNGLETAFKNLRKKSLAIKEDIITVCLIDPDVRNNESESGIKLDRYITGTDEYGENQYKYNLTHNLKKIHREATKEEKNGITDAELQAVYDLTGGQDKKYIVVNGMWKQCTDRVKEILFNKYNILYYYNSYKLTFNHNNIEKAYADINTYELNYKEFELKNENVNENVKKLLYDNANKRHSSAKKIVNNEGEIVNKKYTVREQVNYLKNNEKLINTLVEREAKNIKDDIKSIKLPTETKGNPDLEY